MTIDAVKAGKDVYVEKPISRTIEEGEAMVQAVEASKQVVQTGTQQRSWDHFKLGKELIDSGRLGQTTFVHTYWYQQPGNAASAKVDTAHLDWKAWLGPAPARPFDPERLLQWRHFWDYGGGGFTDLLTHWIDVVHWYMDVEAPRSAVATGANHLRRSWDAPDTSTASLEFPKDFSTAYVGSFNSRTDDGGLEFRGTEATMKIDRRRLAVYRNDAPYAPGTHAPEPEIYVRGGRRRHDRAPAELAGLHAQPQDAHRRHPHGPHRGADVASGEHRAAREAARDVGRHRRALNGRESADASARRPYLPESVSACHQGASRHRGRPSRRPCRR